MHTIQVRFAQVTRSLITSICASQETYIRVLYLYWPVLVPIVYFMVLSVFNIGACASVSAQVVEGDSHVHKNDYDGIRDSTDFRNLLATEMTPFSNICPRQTATEKVAAVVQPPTDM